VTLIDRLDAFLGREIDLAPMALLRRLVGPVVVLHLWPVLRRSLDGVQYRDSFFEPWWSWYPELPRGAYTALLALGVAAGVAMAARAAPRVATVVAFAVVTYNLLLSTTHLHNNRALLCIVLGALALTPTAARGPAWSMRLLQAELVAVYGGSGLSKLFDADWWGGTVTHLRVVRVEHRLRDSPLPDWTIDVLTDRGFHTGAAKVVVLTEVFIAAGLLWRRTRYAAVAAAAVFHLVIEASATVEVFSWLALAALVVWLPVRGRATPATTKGPWPTTPTMPTAATTPRPSARSSG
jgi:hypothetical protein